MADQTRFRSPQRDAGSSQATLSGAKGRFSPRGEDPLAELARLIGQDDPFADFQGEPRATRHQSGNGHAPKNGRGRDPYDDQDYDDRAAYARQAPARRQRFADGEDARGNGRGAYAYGGGHAEEPYLPAPEPSRQPNDGRHPSPQAAKRAPSRAANYAPEVEADYDDPRYARGGHPENGYADPRQEYDDGPYDQDAAGYEAGYEEDGYLGEQDEPGYVDSGLGRRRWLYVGVAAGLACLVLGGGVYGYRALFGKQAGGTPPTIRPADAPNKVPPQNTAQTGTDGGQKLIYDRLDGQQGERIVSREEQPANLPPNQPGNLPPTPGRVVTGPQPAGPVTAFAPVPGPGVPPNTPAVIAGSTPATALPSTEPRKVRTTTVRADGTIVDAPQRTAQPAPAQRPAAQQPLALGPYSQQPAQSDTPDDPNAQAPVTGPTRTAAIAPTAVRTSQPGNQQPWAIVQPPATQPATQPAPVQQASNYVPAGSYVVQVASQKSEADARTSWQQLQSKYANVFGNYQASIKRVDLGDRGTFYRAMLGPFANRDQAYEMCQNLKAAGGECIVQRN